MPERDVESQLRAFAEAIDAAPVPTSRSALHEPSEPVVIRRRPLVAVAAMLVSVAGVAGAVWVIGNDDPNPPSIGVDSTAGSGADQDAVSTVMPSTSAISPRTVAGHQLPVGSIDGESRPDLMRVATGVTLFVRIPSEWNDPSNDEVAVCTSLPEGWNECTPLSFVDSGFLEVESRVLPTSSKLDVWLDASGSYAWLGTLDLTEFATARPESLAARIEVDASLDVDADPSSLAGSAREVVAIDRLRWVGTSQGLDYGTVQVRLDDIPMFVEGFAYGVRLTQDGDVIEERALKDFGPDIYARNRRVEVALEPGQFTIVSALVVGPGGAIPPPDFEISCTTEISVEANTTIVLRLDWESDCLDEVGSLSRPDEFGRRVGGRMGCGPADGPHVYGHLRMFGVIDEVVVEATDDEGNVVGRSAVIRPVQHVDTPFDFGVDLDRGDRTGELRLVDATSRGSEPIVSSPIQLARSHDAPICG